jgi:hypothetical protein
MPDEGDVFLPSPNTSAQTVLHSFQNNGTDGEIPQYLVDGAAARRKTLA